MKRRSLLLGGSTVAAVALHGGWRGHRAAASPVDSEPGNAGSPVRIITDGFSRVPQLSSAPPVTGGGSWEEAAAIGGFHRLYTLDPVTPTARYRFGWHGGELHVEGWIPQEDLPVLAAVVLVLSVDPASAEYTVVEARLNRGRQTGSHTWDEGWRTTPPQWTRRAAVVGVEPTVHEDVAGSVVRFAVPLTALGVTGAPQGEWRGNIVHLTQIATRPVTAWAPMRRAEFVDTEIAFMNAPVGFRACLVPDGAWGVLDFDAGPCDHWRPAAAEVLWTGYGTMRMSLTVPDSGEEPRCMSTLSGRLAADVDWVAPDGRRTTVATDVAVNAGILMVDLAHPVLELDGRYELRVTLRGPAGRTASTVIAFDRSDVVASGVAAVGVSFPAPPSQTVPTAPASPQVQEFLDLIPAQYGMIHLGHPERPDERPLFDNWKLAPDHQHLIHVPTGDVFPNDDYPEDKTAQARNALGQVVDFPYHQDAEGRRYYFTPALWFHQIRRVRVALADVAAADPLGAARILNRWAEVAAGYVLRTNEAWNSYPVDVASGPPYNTRAGYLSLWAAEELSHLDQAIIAFSVAAETNAFDIVSAEAGVDVRARIRTHLFQPALDYVSSVPRRMHNTDPYAWQRMLRLGRAVAEPDLVHEVLEWMEGFAASQFLFDGFWKEITPAYHSQVINNILKALPEISGYSDPPGYASPRTGTRLDDTDLTQRYPALAEQATIPNRLVYPNGHIAPIQDTWANLTRGTQPPPGPLVFPAAGLVRLAAGTGADQTQAHLMVTGKYGHNHRDPLNLALFGERQELLPDIGYTFTKYRQFASSTIGHNTVLVDGADMVVNGSSKHGGLIERVVAEGDLQITRCSFPGAFPAATTYQREIWLVPLVDRDGSYLIDIFRVVGGGRHEYVLRGDANHDAEFETELSTQAYGPYLLPPGTVVTPPVDHTDFGGASGHYPGYQYVREVSEADLADPESYGLTLRTTDANENPLASLRVTGLLDTGAHRLFLGRSPSLRMTRLNGKAATYDNNEQADLYDLPVQVLRREGQNLSSTFVTVFEPFAGLEPTIELSERLTIAAGPADAVAVRITHGDTVDTVISSPSGSGTVSVDGMQFDGEFAHARVVDGGLRRLTAIGGTTVSRGSRTVSSPGTWSAGVRGTTSVSSGATANSLEADAPPTFDPAGRYATVTHPDATGNTVLVTSAASVDGGVVLDLGPMEPGFVFTDDGTRQTHFPTRSWPTGSHEVAVLSTSTSDYQDPAPSTAVGTIHGTAVDQDDQPLPDVAVKVTGLAHPTALSGADGAFVLTGVPVGEQHVTARRPGYVTDVSASITLTGSGTATTTVRLMDRGLPPELADVTRYAVPGQQVSVTTSLPGTVHLVPDDTAREAAAIRAAAGVTLLAPTAGVAVALDTTGMAPGRYVACAIEVHDRVSPFSSVTLLQGGSRTIENEDADAVDYTGSWKKVTTAVASGGNYRYTSARQASVTIGFHGTRGECTAHVNESGGLAEVFVDGQKVGDVDYYAPELTWHQVIFDTGELPRGVHTITVVCRGTKSPNNPSTQYQVRLDSVRVTDE